MKIPNLMPNQMEPFNGDHFIEKKFLKLRDEYGIKTIVETGTCLGSSTIFFAKHFENVITIEANMEYQTIAINRCAKEKINNVQFLFGDSSKILLGALSKLADEKVFLLVIDNLPGTVKPLVVNCVAILDKFLIASISA